MKFDGGGLFVWVSDWFFYQWGFYIFGTTTFCGLGSRVCLTNTIGSEDVTVCQLIRCEAGDDIGAQILIALQLFVGFLVSSLAYNNGRLSDGLSCKDRIYIVACLK